MPTVPTQATRAWSSADARSLRTSSCTIGPSGSSPPKGRDAQVRYARRHAPTPGTMDPRIPKLARLWRRRSRSTSPACAPHSPVQSTQALLCGSAVCSRADSIELSASQGDDGAAARRRGDLGTHSAVGGAGRGSSQALRDLGPRAGRLPLPTPPPRAPTPPPIRRPPRRRTKFQWLLARQQARENGATPSLW